MTAWPLLLTEFPVKVYSRLQTRGVQHDDQRRQLSQQEAHQLHPPHHTLVHHFQHSKVSRKDLDLQNLKVIF